MSIQQNFDLETPTPLGDDDYEFDDSNKLDPPNIQACIDQERKELIPIKKVEYSIKIEKGLEIYKVKQFYQNILNEPIMVDFLFHVQKKAVLTELQFDLNGHKYKAGIIEKKEAKQQFQQGIKDGMTMSYSSYDSKFKDLIRVQIGNLGSYQELILEFTYIQPLQLIGGNFYQIKICNVKLNDKQQKLLPNINPYKMDYKQILEIEINMKNITYCKSHTHEIQMDKDVKGNLLIIFCQMETNQNEFNLLYQSEDESQEIILSQTNNDNLQEQRYCATIIIDPRFKKFKQEDAQQTRVDTYLQKKYILFILDLRGDYLKEKKQVIQQFLKNIDKYTLFNILIIGQQSSKFLKDFEFVDTQNIQQFNKLLNKMEKLNGVADSNISELIKSNRDQQIIYIGSDDSLQNIEQDKRVNSFMIRNNNQYLLEKADISQGFYEIIDYFGENNIDNKIKRYLGLINNPILTKFQMTSDLQSIQCMIPNPQSIQQLSINKILYIYIIFTTKQKNIFFSLQCSNHQQDVFHQIEVNTDSGVDTDNYHKIVGKKLIKKLHNAFIKRLQRINKVLIRQDSLSKNDMLNYSLQYQIISPLTAFICELDKLNDIDFQIIQKKVTYFNPENDQLSECEAEYREQQFECQEYESEDQSREVFDLKQVYQEEPQLIKNSSLCMENPPQYESQNSQKFQKLYNKEIQKDVKFKATLNFKRHSSNESDEREVEVQSKLSSAANKNKNHKGLKVEVERKKQISKEQLSKNKQILPAQIRSRNQKVDYKNHEGIKDSKGNEIIKYELQSTVQQGINQPIKSPKYSILSSSKLSKLENDNSNQQFNTKIDINMIKSTNNKASQHLLETQYIQTERNHNQNQIQQNIDIKYLGKEMQVDVEPRIQMIKGTISKNRKVRIIKDNQDDLNIILSYFSDINKCFSEKIQNKLDFSSCQCPEQLTQLQWINILVIEILVTMFQKFESQWIKIQFKVEEWLLNELISVLSFFQFRRLGHKIIKQQQLQILL
ncbi:hypothetical protein pb186bvf_011706 [Paramecium bursaria]